MPPAEPARPERSARPRRAAARLPPEAAEARRMAQDLRASIAQDGFVLHYQPRVALATGALVAAEALIRWPHRRRGLVPPNAFIPLAEETGLIDEIGGFVLREACREAAAWPEAVTVSVNVSAGQLREGRLIAQLARALEESGLDPERLEIELTESMLVEADEATLLTLGAVRDQGVGVSLDDLGTGYASLAMLKRLPLTAIKLDRSLTRGVPADPEDSAIVRALVGTGRALGLCVVGEGVETEAQRDFLAALGTDEAQGFLFSRAIPAPALRERLRAALNPA